MKQKQEARIPVLGMTKLINEAKGVIDKRKLYAIASDTNKKFGLITAVLAKQTAGLNQMKKEVDSQKAEPVSKSTASIASLTNSLDLVSVSLNNAAKALSSLLIGKKSNDRSFIGADPKTDRPPEQQNTKQPSQSEMTGTFKDLFTNPAVVAAVTGLVYLVLPKETQEKVKAFLGGFAGGITSTMQENDEAGFGSFNKILKTAGVAIAGFFGVKLLMSLGSAISTVWSIVTSFSIKKISLKTVAYAGAAVAGGLYMMNRKEGEGLEQISVGNAGSSAPPSAMPEQKPQTSGSGGDTVKESSSSSPAPGQPSAAGTGSNVDLRSVMTIQPDVETEGINPALKQRLAAMAAEYKEKTGKKMVLTSGYRSSEKQAALYAQKGPPLAAPPGRSLHEKGLAIDMNSADANQAVAMGLFDKYGFKRPVKGEAWHVEPVETRGGPQFADNPVAPGQPVVVATKTGKAQVAGSGKQITQPELAAVSQPKKHDIGSVVNSVSAEVNNGDRPNLAKQLATNVNNKNGASSMADIRKDVGPIISPVASRGSLSTGTKFLTACV